jgi:hypothetical protein
MKARLLDDLQILHGLAALASAVASVKKEADAARTFEAQGVRCKGQGCQWNERIYLGCPNSKLTPAL